MIKSVAIIGCGWFGMQLAHALIKANYRVLGSTTRQEKLAALENSGIEPYLLTISASSVDGHYEDIFSADVVIINLPPGRHSNGVHDYPKKIERVFSLIAPYTKMIFVSSSSVYQACNDVVTETMQCEPESPSGKVLLEAENLVRGANTCILRFSGLIGPTRPAARFMSGKINISNGRAPVNLVQGQDCVTVTKAIMEKNLWGEIYNVCSSEHPQRQVFYTEECKRLGYELPTFIDEAGPYKIVDNSKLCDALGFRFSALQSQH